ncbi:MAG: HDOD domain-containing protein [Herminiimonas sp.]|nr:HDOD domain-containing protein [Herminiimonas sp.]
MTQTITQSPEKTLDLLWSRVRRRGDLPGFSRVIGAIVGAMRGDNDREFNMTKTVLADPALTQRVLRLANSAMYSVFGQDINTVSKAVIVLGTDSIGHLALGLKLIDGLSAASPESCGARGEMEKALLAGHIARQVASTATMYDTEEAVVCSMLHSLGRMMVSFYLPELWQAIQERLAEGGSEMTATDEVLGLGFDAVGRLVAQQWGLPAGLVATLHDVVPRLAHEPLGHTDWLAAVSTLSTRCADLICSQPAAGGILDAAIGELAGDYASMLGLDREQLLVAVEGARESAQNDAGVQLPRLAHAEPAAQGSVQIALAGKPVDAAQILARGVADMRGASASASTSQLLTMALETVFKGLGFSRTIAFLRNPDQERYVARLVFGDGLQELASRLAFSDAYQPDVFHAALANDKMIFIENAQDPNFMTKLPRWLKEALPTATSFMVLPLIVNRHPIGLIYGDWDLSLPRAKINFPEVVPLDELRQLVVRAIEQRRQVDPSWGRGKL